jgi:protein gp37
MSDLFHPAIPSDFLLRSFTVMLNCPQHKFQILTKRPARMASVMPGLIDRIGSLPPNVWLGTSVESNEYLARIASLQATPAVIRFLSLEPLLGPMPNINLAASIG